ncbi:trypsin-like peptidase domain-containing protein [Candidatus Peregrinibacteria bacterium]|nr:trypsin-like peptidase domain-containing protein [Candidatus Peregrinibacteria bacterium]
MSRRFRFFWIGAVTFLLLALPSAYLVAKHLTLKKQLEELRKNYPQFTEEEVAVIEAVKRAQSSVVSIVQRKEVFAPSEKLLDLGNGFKIAVPGELKSQGKQVIGQGSGFIIRNDGLVVTNKHVVADRTSDYQAILNDGTKLDAAIVASDPFNDVAFLKLTPDAPTRNFSALPLGDSSKIMMGQTVIAIGNALGELQNSVTKGIISGLNRAILASDQSGGFTERLVKIIQTDAAINPGNSGGPLLATNGMVIGMNTAVNQGAENIGFAIPIEDIRFAMKSYKKNGRIVRPFVGVRYAAITKDLQARMSLPFESGMVLLDGDKGEPAVIPGSPAAVAGLKSGDIILEMNGTVLDEENDIVSLIRDFSVGDKVQLKLWQKSSKVVVTVEVTLAEMK